MTIRIDKNVPIPGTAAAGKHKEIIAALQEMEVGDSFIIPEEFNPKSIHQYALYANVKIKTRTTENGLLRVWRIA